MIIRINQGIQGPAGPAGPVGELSVFKVFVDTAERNAYFTSYPADKVAGRVIAITGEPPTFQVWSGTAWVEVPLSTMSFGTGQFVGDISLPGTTYLDDNERSLADKLYTDMPTLLDYDGADPTGATPSDDAVTAFLADLVANGGGVLRIPAGTYWFDDPRQIKGAMGIHIIGDGIDVTKIIRKRNQAAALIRFYLGYYNSVRDLTLDCDGYDGRGLYFQDIGSFAKRVKVINCPDRSIAGNGGSTALYGLDVEGRESTDENFTTATFFPEGCYITECKVERAGATAYSFKRMPKFKVFCNEANEVWSEGATIDVRSDYAEVWGNTFINVCRSDSSTEFPDKENGGFLTVGTGGVGGIGIDAARYSKVYSNNIVGVQMNLSEGAKVHPAICFINNYAATFGTQVWGNHIEDADVGLYMKGIAEGAAAGSFSNLIGPNTFKNVLTEYKLDAGCENNVIERGSAPEEGTLSIECSEADNHFPSSGSTNTLVAKGMTAEGTFSYVANGQRILWERDGKSTIFSVYLAWSAQLGATGQLKVEGLPFVSAADANHSSIFPCSFNGSAVVGQVFAHIPPGYDYFLFYLVENGVRINLEVPAVADIRISGVYLS